jgi:tetratricopeptide (TPR) repeat protein
MTKVRLRPLTVSILFVVLARLAYPQVDASDAAGLPDYQMGLQYAKSGDYQSAYASFSRAYAAKRDSPAVWYSMGLAAAHIPGYELRAGALFKAYMLARPDGNEIAAVLEASKSLSARVDENIGLLLDQAQETSKLNGSTLSALCAKETGMVQTAALQALAGHAGQAQTLLASIHKNHRCSYVIPNASARLAINFAQGGQIDAAEPYLAMWQSQMSHPNGIQNYPPEQLCNGRSCDFEDRMEGLQQSVGVFQSISLSELEAGNMTAAREYDRKAIASLKELDAAHEQAPPAIAAHARMIACVDRQFAWKGMGNTDEAVPLLVEWRNWAYSHDRFPSDADSEMVRDAAAFAGLDFPGDEVVTAGALHDPELRNRWLHYKVPLTPTKSGESYSISIEGADQVTDALSDEPELLRCLDNVYIENLLLRIGTSGYRIEACNGNDADLAACLQNIQNWPRQTPLDRFDRLDQLMRQLVRVDDLVFARRWYEHSYLPSNGADHKP